ncbi:DciA family protein [Microvirga sp. W0021]|uniref:DciA family protein n=1 Tax=Hohaiivirga grylli TaxID=3133970 RepID=A0ABV0BLF9_9HYPH
MARQARLKAKPLAELIEGCLSPSLAAQGFATSDVLIAWPDIVGEKLAAFTRPMKLEWPRRRASFDPDERPMPATLVIRVESAFALEMQHQSPLIIEKVNTYFGWRCVGKIVLKQGPVHREEKQPQQRPPISENEREQIKTAIGNVEDEPLREALERLGKSVLTSNKNQSR